jgi:hypothetical protein
MASFLDPPGLTRAQALTVLGPGVVEDATDAGTYLIVDNRLIEDPADPGTYLIGA